MTSYLFLLVFKLVESLQCILKGAVRNNKNNEIKNEINPPLANILKKLQKIFFLSKSHQFLYKQPLSD